MSPKRRHRRVLNETQYAVKEYTKSQKYGLSNFPMAHLENRTLLIVSRSDLLMSMYLEPSWAATNMSAEFT